MPYPKDIAAKSHAVLLMRREQAAERDARLRAEVARRLPEALTLERDIAATSARLAQAVLSRTDVARQVEQIRTVNLDAQRMLAGMLTGAGFDADALAPHSVCARCGDTGVDGLEICDCVRQIQKKLMYERLGADAPIEICGFDRFDLRFYPSPEEKRTMSRILAFCRSWAESFTLAASSLLLRGAPGLGKTHLSLSMGSVIIDKGFDVLYVPFNTLLGRLEAARFGKGDDEYYAGLATVLRAELLILDDLGAEFSTSFGAAVLYEIVNSRQLQGRPSIISTNLTENELKSRYGERLYSRLYGGFEVLPFVGEDVRLQKMYAN